MENDTNIDLDLKTNGTYITNVDEFINNLKNTPINNNVYEYLINFKRYLNIVKFSNQQQIVSAIDLYLAKNCKEEGEVHEHRL